MTIERCNFDTAFVSHACMHKTRNDTFIKTVSKFQILYFVGILKRKISSSIMNIVHGHNCFRITFFHIDSYITKPDLVLDETYSSFRKRNINLATIIRLFGTTDDGISTCIHIHQHFPHLTIRREDLFECYRIESTIESTVDHTAILDVFVKDLENSLSQFVDSRSQDEIQIINVEPHDSL